MMMMMLSLLQWWRGIFSSTVLETLWFGWRNKRRRKRIRRTKKDKSEVPISIAAKNTPTVWLLFPGGPVAGFIQAWINQKKRSLTLKQIHAASSNIFVVWSHFVYLHWSLRISRRHFFFSSLCVCVNMCVTAERELKTEDERSGRLNGVFSETRTKNKQERDHFQNLILRSTSTI